MAGQKPPAFYSVTTPRRKNWFFSEQTLCSDRTKIRPPTESPLLPRCPPPSPASPLMSSAATMATASCSVRWHSLTGSTYRAARAISACAQESPPQPSGEGHPSAVCSFHRVVVFAIVSLAIVVVALLRRAIPARPPPIHQPTTLLSPARSFVLHLHLTTFVSFFRCVFRRLHDDCS